MSDIERALFELPDVSFERLETPAGFDAAFVLMVKQPIDHNDHSLGYFHQRVFLSHRFGEAEDTGDCSRRFEVFGCGQN